MATFPVTQTATGVSVPTEVACAGLANTTFAFDSPSGLTFKVNGASKLAVDASGMTVSSVDVNYAGANISRSHGTVTDNAAGTVVYSVEYFDLNSNNNNTTGKFTAPVNGYYRVTFSTHTTNLSASSMVVCVVVAGVTVVKHVIGNAGAGTATYNKAAIDCIVYAAQSQDIYISTANIGPYGGIGGVAVSQFSVVLIAPT